MVLSAQIPVNSYVGTSAASSFAFNFPVFDEEDLLVTALNTVTGTVNTLVFGTDYSVSTIPSGIASTGTIALINASQAWLSSGNLATNWTLSIVINNPFAQTFSFRNQGDFYRTSIENALDYQMMCIQQLQVGGFILVDIITGLEYKLIMINGVLSQIEIT